MKTITIKNPWAYLICSGEKNIENRTWPTKFRGRVLVHASANPVKNFPNPLNVEQWNSLSPDQKLLLRSNILTNSAIIGSVEIVDCTANHESIWAQHSAKKWKKNGEFIDEVEVPVYNWVLADPVLFAKPILNVKGRLSFWEYPMTEEEYLNQIKVVNSAR